MIYVWFGLLLAYLVLQTRLVCRLRGRWRLAAAGPLLMTVPALALALRERDEHWPIPLLCANPLALLSLVIVWGIYWAYADPTR
ncbi:MAG TPA: hypothetical protein VGE07_06170 [Herpetosiphonaceae bacterium]